MGIRQGDLVDTVLSKLSIDEYEPKTGDSKDVVVLGINVTEDSVGQDLYNFLSSGVHEVRDIEVSPNPNQDGYYMVFVELDRNDRALQTIREMITDVENAAGKLSWKAKTHLTDDYIPLNSEEIDQIFISSPDDYVTREQADEMRTAEPELPEESDRTPDLVLEFLAASSLTNASVSDEILTLEANKFNAKLKIVDFGQASDIMKNLGISESAIKPLNTTLRKFNYMLGEMRAINIDNYVVIYHPENTNILVTKPCLD